ncbi:MAG: CHAT domain-containing tetratricopeptide repeat protein [Pseudomonadota bacterium]
MRVFSGQQRTWLAGLLVGLCLGPGSAAPARAQEATTAALDMNGSLAVDLSQRDAARIKLPGGIGYAVLRADEHLLSASLSVPEGDTSARLTSLGMAPIIWLFELDTEDKIVEIAVLDRHALKPEVRLTLQPAPEAALGAWAAETALGRLPENASDESLQAYGAKAEQAAAAWALLESEKDVIRNLLRAAAHFEDADDYERARDLARAAAARADRAGNTVALGLANNAIGLASIELEDFDTARDVLPLARTQLNPIYGKEAVNPAQSNLCYLAFETRAFDEAESCYLKLKAKAKTVGNGGAAIRYDNLLAGVYWNRGNTSQAAEILRSLVEQPGISVRQRARLRNNLGISLRALGQPQDALNYYQQSLDVARELGIVGQIEQVTNNMAVVYGDLGAPHQAVELLAEAYALSQGRGDREAARRARNYGAALMNSGRAAEASDILTGAIDLAKALEDQSGLVEAYRLAAFAEFKQGRADMALKLATAASTAAEALGESSRQRALAFAMLGNAQLATGDAKAAIRSQQQSLALWEEIGNPYGSAQARIALGFATRAQGDLAGASQLALTAIDNIEALRTEIASRDLRATYQSYVGQAYELAVESLMARGDIQQALEMTERFRAKTLIDALSQGASRSDIEIPADLARQRADAIAAINRASDAKLRGRKAPSVAALLTELDVINDRIAESTGIQSDTQELTDVDAAAIQALHAPGDLTLVYFMSADAGFLWIIDAEKIDVVTLNDVGAIDRDARDLHKAISRQGRYSEQAAALGQSLLMPIASRIEAAKRIAIIADGALHYVPFDVLTPSRNKPPVLTDKPVTFLPSLTAVALTRERSPSKGRGIAVLADPVFNVDDDRLAPEDTTRSGYDLNRLRMSRFEAEAIVEQAGDIEVRVHLGLAATADQLRSSDVTDANILHIATHGFADDEIPARSGIALSMVDKAGDSVTGFVGLRDIYNLRLDADLVVLSACETALGQDLAGEGLLGLTRGFMNAGARRVVASLWQVQDRATAELMGAFYAELFEGAAPAEALMRAKTQLRANRRYKHPYYWSGFTLQGDWRPWQVR